jgi:hypothetical protein
MSASEIARILPRIDEERQLPKQRQRRPAIPFDMHRAGETVEAHALHLIRPLQGESISPMSKLKSSSDLESDS